MLYKPICNLFVNNYKQIFSKIIIESCGVKPHDVRFYSFICFNANSVRDFRKRLSRQTTTLSTSNERITRQEPGVVRLSFIPDEWFTFFFPKTGVSGLGTFAFTFSTFLMSKEFYVMEHEYYGGLSMAILCVLSVKYAGPGIAKYLDKEIDEYAQSWTDIKNHNKAAWEKAIKHEEKLQKSKEGQLMLIEAKRENVALQREAAYRKRIKHAYAETVRRLEYAVSIQQVQQSIIRRHMQEWVVKEVGKSLTEELKREALEKSLSDLKELAKTFKKLTEDYPPIKYREPSKKPED